MTSAWPWLAVAGMGALHGLNPAAGWLCAAAWGVRRGDRAHALRALAPIAIGHASSVALVAAVVAAGLAAERGVLTALAGGLAVVVGALALCDRLPLRARASAGQAGLALWSFMAATAQGAGMMLVPALMPLCLSDSPAREITASGSLLLALAAVALHMAAMLVVTGAMAAAACHGLGRFSRPLRIGWAACRMLLARPRGAGVRPRPSAAATAR